MSFYVVLKFWSLCCCLYVLCLHLYSSSQWPSNSCESRGWRPAHTQDLVEAPREGSVEWRDPRLLRGLQACFIWQTLPVWDCRIQQRGREGTSSADRQSEVRVCEMIKPLTDLGLKCLTVLKLKIVRKSATSGCQWEWGILVVSSFCGCVLKWWHVLHVTVNTVQHLVAVLLL